MNRVLVLAFAGLMFAAGLAVGQTKEDSVEAWDATYNYDAGSRRDPFEPITGSKVPVPPGTITVSSAVIVGITKTQSEYLTLMKGPDGKTRFFREGDKLYDGEIISITSSEVVFKQDLRVMDPESVVQYKEVRKKLHPENR